MDKVKETNKELHERVMMGEGNGRFEQTLLTS